MLCLISGLTIDSCFAQGSSASGETKEAQENLIRQIASKLQELDGTKQELAAQQKFSANLKSLLKAVETVDFPASVPQLLRKLAPEGLADAAGSSVMEKSAAASLIGETISQLQTQEQAAFDGVFLLIAQFEAGAQGSLASDIYADLGTELRAAVEAQLISPIDLRQIQKDAPEGENVGEEASSSLTRRHLPSCKMILRLGFGSELILPSGKSLPSRSGSRRSNAAVWN